MKAFSVIDEGDDRIIENSKLKDEIANLHKQMESKEVSGKSKTSYLNIIQALKDELIENGKFENQTELIEFLSCPTELYYSTNSNTKPHCWQ